jgi:hypothetical protein
MGVWLGVLNGVAEGVKRLPLLKPELSPPVEEKEPAGLDSTERVWEE